ncbi:MAG: YggT family protein [Pseudomonadota bacterium]
MNPFLDHWTFNVPNYLLAILMYMALGRFVLSFLFPADAPNLILRAFVSITEPAVRPVRFITPAAVPHRIVLLFTFLWIFLLRVGFFMAMAANDLIPPLAPGATG